MAAKTLTSGELAHRAFVSTDTLRHYERQGLLPRPARGANGYRRYPESALDRVQLIRRALHVGFTIHELGEVLRIRDRGGIPCARVREIAGCKLKNIEARLTELIALRDQLRNAIRRWDRDLARTRPGNPARLLESLKIAANRSCRASPFSTNCKQNQKKVNR